MTGHTDLYLGGDAPMWKIICHETMCVQTIPLPFPKDYCCTGCGANLQPSTTFVGVDPRVEMVGDKTLYDVKTWTRDLIRRAARGKG